ncbi:paraquat-inducible protein A [Polynucleobacter antarcticus]|uniref:Paraquat-inducible protein A n=1 Tax=Polynucleobacter antarcticus TaxID=1743162 RepID=A0A6M9PPW7_9BURK|nr:paraquat-inducible protein A [Polynucleobacter antarcticus]QKM62421.1 paraquat-inducible protein A [Polynucleobacter antarcticus]
MDLKELLVCDQCDLLLQETPLKPGGKALCSRCGAVLYRSLPLGLERSLVFSLTSATLFLVSNSFPIVTISSQGLTNSTTLLDAAYRLFNDGILSIAGLVFITTFLMPALEIMALIYLLLPVKLGRLPPGFSYAFRLIHFVKPWAMVEVFMLGLLVTITKLNAFASVEPDIGLVAFILLMISMTAAAANFDTHDFWRKVAQIKASGSRAC